MNDNPKTIKELLSNEFKKLQCTEGGVAISNGRNNGCYSFGKAHLEYNIDINRQSVFDTASIGKLFTETLILGLVKEHKLSLDIPVIQILKDLPNKWS